MKTYCPYSNINSAKLAKNEYPHLLVVGGMNDPRVAFFEPLRLVAKMRGLKQKWHMENSTEADVNDNMLLLQIDDAGHGGNSGQYSYLESLAFEYAFLISSLKAPMKSIVNFDASPETIFGKSNRQRKSRKDDKHNGTRAKGRMLNWINNMF